MTSIDITITVCQPGANKQPIREFRQHFESEILSTSHEIWINTVGGLEKIMGKMHRAYFPTEEEAAADAASPDGVAPAVTTGGQDKKDPDIEAFLAATQEFNDALVGVMQIVEGVRSVRWNHEGRRLKDTPEWCRFYVAAKTLERMSEPGHAAASGLKTTPGNDAIATGNPS